MGTKASLPIPTDADFCAAAKQAAATPVFPSLLGCDSKWVTSPDTKQQDVHFTISSKVWNDKDGQTTELVPLGVKLVVVENQQGKMLLVQSLHDDTLVAVLRQPVEYPRPLQICAPSTTHRKPAVLTYQGQALYEVATVDKIRDSSQHVLRVDKDDDDDSPSLLMRTDKCGPAALQDRLVHQVQHVQDKANHNKPLSDVALRAYIQEQPAATWGVRVMTAAADPLLVLLLVVATDRWAVRDAEFFRQASRVNLHNTGGRGLVKNVT